MITQIDSATGVVGLIHWIAFDLATGVVGLIPLIPFDSLVCLRYLVFRLRGSALLLVESWNYAS